MKITDLSAAQISSKIKTRQLSSTEVTRAFLDEIILKDTDINAYITINESEAMTRAEEVQKMIDKGHFEGSPLAGLPISLKDNICTKGIKTTCASRMLENYVPPYNAQVVDKLEATGAIIIGKLNMDEFAMGSTSESSYFGPVSNPRKSDHVPGGSSGGCAAAIASGEALLTLGSDTGGSIRQPAAMCGVTGFKPSYGAVSRYGLIAHASSLEQIGPIAKTAEDCTLCMSIIGGHDCKDSTTFRDTINFTSLPLRESLSGLKIGLPVEYFKDNSPDVTTAVLNGVNTLKQLGAEIYDISLPFSKYAVAAYYIIASSEAGSNLARYDGIRYGYRASHCQDPDELYKKTRSEGFGPEVKTRIMLGTFALSSGYYDEYYKKATISMYNIKNSFNEAFSNIDIIITPTTPATAPKKGESLTDPLKMYLSDAYTVSANLAGLPALSIPCGFDRNGLPIGMQLIGPYKSDAKILQIGTIFQQHTTFHNSILGGGAI